MAIESRATDVFHTPANDGAPAIFLNKSLVNAGIDLNMLTNIFSGVSLLVLVVEKTKGGKIYGQLGRRSEQFTMFNQPNNKTTI